MNTSILKPPFTRGDLRTLCALASAHLLSADIASMSLDSPAKALRELWSKTEPLLNGAVDKQRIKIGFTQTATTGKANNLRAAACMLLFWHLFQYRAGACSALRQTFPAFAAWQRAATTGDKSGIRSALYRFGELSAVPLVANVLRVANGRPTVASNVSHATADAFHRDLKNELGQA
jgi:hypothetical protein